MEDKSRKKAERPRKLPRNIVEKDDREIMTRIFGKRAMKEIDRTLQEHDGDDVTNDHTER